MPTHEEFIHNYFAALNADTVEARALEFFTPDLVQEEFPNRLVPNGVTRDLAAVQEGARRGRALMAAQRFDVLNVIVQGDRAAVEANWQGTVGADIGPFKKGMVMKARFGIFLEFRDGRICRQHNYDCFEPW